MIQHGPVDVVVLAAGEPRLDGGVFAELERQAERLHRLVHVVSFVITSYKSF